MTASALRHLRHALAVQPHLADAFDPREYVINCLAADAHEFRTNDASHEIAGKIENFLRSRAFESFAKNRGHRAGKRLHFRAKSHPNVRFAILIHVQINAHGVRAFLVFSHIDEIELLAFARLLLLRVVRVGHQRLAPFVFRQRFEQIDDFGQLRRIHWRIEFSANLRKWNTGLWAVW